MGTGKGKTKRVKNTIIDSNSYALNYSLNYLVNDFAENIKSSHKINYLSVDVQELKNFYSDKDKKINLIKHYYGERLKANEITNDIAGYVLTNIMQDWLSVDNLIQLQTKDGIVHPISNFSNVSDYEITVEMISFRNVYTLRHIPTGKIVSEWHLSSGRKAKIAPNATLGLHYHPNRGYHKNHPQRIVFSLLWLAADPGNFNKPK